MLSPGADTAVRFHTSPGGDNDTLDIHKDPIFIALQFLRKEVVETACFSMICDEFPLDENGGVLLPPLEYSFFDVARRLENLYITYRGRFVMMTKDDGVFIPRYKDPKTGKIKYQKITNNIVCGHLNGHYSICVYAGSASSKFICFDVDDGNPKTVRTVMDILSKAGFPRNRIYVSTSGGKGFHVEMFFSSLMFTSDLKNIYNYVCAVGKLDKTKVEFRPTGGQSIKLPLSIHRKTGNTCWYLDRDTLEPIKDLNYIMDIQQIPHELALSIARTLPCCGPRFGDEQEKVTDRVLSDDEIAEFYDDHYPDLTEQGKRNALMVQIAVHNRYRGLSRENSEEELRAWYHRQNPEYINSDESLVESEIVKILDWVFSDKFVLSAKQENVIFRRDDIRILLAQTKRTERLILFLIQYYTKAYGSCCLSMDRISKLSGLSIHTVHTSIQSLIKNKWVDIVSASKAKKTEYGYCGVANRYRASDRSYNWAAGQFEYMPAIDDDKRRLIFSIPLNTEEFKISEDKKIKELFGEVFAFFLNDEAIKQCFHLL